MDLSVIPRWKNRNTNRTCIVVVHREKLGSLSNYNDDDDDDDDNDDDNDSAKKQLGL